MFFFQLEINLFLKCNTRYIYTPYKTLTLKTELLIQFISIHYFCQLNIDIGFGAFVTCPYIVHRIMPFIILTFWRQLHGCPNLISKGDSQRDSCWSVSFLSLVPFFHSVFLSSHLLHLPQAGWLARLVTASPWLPLKLALPFISKACADSHQSCVCTYFFF